MSGNEEPSIEKDNASFGEKKFPDEGKSCNDFDLGSVRLAPGIINLLSLPFALRPSAMSSL